MSSKEQRQSPRADSLNLSFFCIDEENNITQQGMGRTLNVSTSGILLETNETLPQGKTVNMEIAMKNDIINASGTIIHSTQNNADSYHTGIQFVTLSDNDKETLGVFV